MPIGDSDLLLVVDLQRDFCPGGALAVPGGDEIVPLVNELARRFRHLALTQDWHPAGHSSFASEHPGRKPFETIELAYGAQTLWPDHCIQGTTGAEFHPGLAVTGAELIIRKGFRREVDSYSAFHENDRRTPTGLGGYLRERGFRRIFLAGLAFDYCVRWSAEDGRRAGFEAVVIKDACRAIALGRSVPETIETFREVGVGLIESSELQG